LIVQGQLSGIGVWRCVAAGYSASNVWTVNPGACAFKIIIHDTTGDNVPAEGRTVGKDSRKKRVGEE
jgi:hypothetical protein